MILCDHFSYFTQVTVSKRPLWKTHQKGHLGDVLDNRNRSLRYVKRSLKKTLRVNHGPSGLKDWWIPNVKVTPRITQARILKATSGETTKV